MKVRMIRSRRIAAGTFQYTPDGRSTTQIVLSHPTTTLSDFHVKDNMGPSPQSTPGHSHTATSSSSCPSVPVQQRFKHSLRMKRAVSPVTQDESSYGEKMERCITGGTVDSSTSTLSVSPPHSPKSQPQTVPTTVVPTKSINVSASQRFRNLRAPSFKINRHGGSSVKDASGGAATASLTAGTDDDLCGSPVVDPLDQGCPGFLTLEEKGVLVKFRDEIKHRPPEFRSTIFCFGDAEPEPYALCRWLRARKFVLNDVIEMIESATELRAEATLKNFYPNAVDALGVEESIYKSQYPQLYFGRAKNGCPVFISKPGVLNMTGLECITTVTGMYRYQWHSMVHAFGSRLRALQKRDPNFRRFQSVCIIDMEHLSRESISKRVMDLVQHQSHVDGLCFPETLNRLVVVNAPSYFALTWRIVKRWLDPRTCAKIEIIAGRHRWENRLRELVDEEELPSDYGGKAESTVNVIARMENPYDEGEAKEKIDRRITETMSVRHHATTVFEMHDGEEMEVLVYTRSAEETSFRVEKLDGTASGHHFSSRRVSVSAVTGEVKVKFNGGEVGCLQKTIATHLKGPGKVRITANSDRGRMSSAEHFLLVGNVVRT